MALNPLEYLRLGKTDFLFRLTEEDHNWIIENIRKSEIKDDIIKGFLPIIKDELPTFCFQVIYDDDNFLNETKYLFNKLYTIDKISNELLEKIIKESTYGKIILIENFNKIINKFENIDFILEIMFNDINKYYSILKQLSINKNLHIRFKFMNYLIKNYSNYMVLFYDDITKYFTDYTYENYEQLRFYNELMDSSDISTLAFTILDNNIDYNLFLKIKKFIFDNYEANSLLKNIFDYQKETINNNTYRLISNKQRIEEFKKDSDNYFKTAQSGRINILNSYEENISKELLDKFKYYLSFFENKYGLDLNYKKLDYYGLGIKLEKYIDKYLEISTDKTHDYIRRGTTASCYRIGDYVFKLVTKKWSFENIICPDLYLILPNLEEELIRDNQNIVQAGIEIQKYLKKDVRNVPKKIFKLYEQELSKLGYYTTDSLKGGVAGDNTRLLNNYIDSGNLNPPDWFKIYPIVLVDRDRVYENSNKRPKQLYSGIS